MATPRRFLGEMRPLVAIYSPRSLVSFSSVTMKVRLHALARQV